MAFESTSFPSSSVRHRVLRRIFSNLNPKPFELDLPPLKPGEMQLYSYYTPGISTGLYDIVAEQTIHTSDGSQSKTIRALDQSFFVYAPKYSLDPALVHSTFPHQGVAAQANILPHVVLNDPHLPWQTEIGKTSEKDTLRIPWLAVIAFEQSELKLQPGDPLFPDQSLPQSFTMTTRLTVGQLLSSGLQCALPALDEDLLEDPKLPLKSIDVIFPEMDLFLALFGGGTSDAPQIDLDRFKYLAHARKVNTTHMADSGVLDEGEFSIVFSHRTGPPFEKNASPEPKRCVAHLVSLDWIHRIPASGLKSNKRAAVISLFSWTYDCIPPETVNFEDVMRAVGKNNEVFRTPDDIRSKVNKDLPPAVHSRIKDRLDDGYTLARYRVQTGEETYALMRGPLTPYAVPGCDLDGYSLEHRGRSSNN
ncbi:hypothetical protein APHAL10511_002191 [Amanita phalloides]|nr:hypothetical protein APHAL10511_002191 [Amanita phalloides]